MGLNWANQNREIFWITNKLDNYTLYSLSVISLAKSLQLIFIGNQRITYRLVDKLVICYQITDYSVGWVHNAWFPVAIISIQAP